MKNGEKEEAVETICNVEAKNIENIMLEVAVDLIFLHFIFMKKTLDSILEMVVQSEQ